MDAICTWGYDEKCTLDWPAANQATCPHGLGTPEALTSAPVYNIQYPSGKKVLAGSSPSASTGDVGNAGSASMAPLKSSGLMIVAGVSLLITGLVGCL